MIGRMNESPLHVGELVKCPRCRRWHPAIRWHTEGTHYTVNMLYVVCRGQRYYAGQDGLPSRHEARTPRNGQFVSENVKAAIDYHASSNDVIE